MKPRMLWFCHWVALAISAIVAPSSRRKSSRTIDFLLPSRTSAALASLLTEALFLADDFVFDFAAFFTAVLSFLFDASVLTSFFDAALVFLPTLFGFGV